MRNREDQKHSCELIMPKNIYINTYQLNMIINLENECILLQAIDVWSNICVSFVFLALLEYALVNYAARADARHVTSKLSS